MSLIKDKVILITGGARGIGWACVKLFLLNGAKGVSILNISKVVDNEFATPYLKSGKILQILCDISKKSELEDAFKKTVQVYNQLDIVINNAAICDEVKWEMTLALNLEAVMRGTLLAMKEYLPKYKSGDEGIIVNISAFAGINPVAEVPVYSITKYAINQLGRSLGGEVYYNRYKVRILTVCPGAVRTRSKFMVNGDRMDLLDSLEEKLSLVTFQSPECTANAILTAINEGKNGSVWITKNERAPYEIQFLSREYH